MVLIPLTLWLIYSLIHHLGAPYETARQWVMQPLVAIGLAIFIIAMFYHAKLGLQVIIEDYIATLSSRNSILRISNLLCWLAMFAGLISVAVIVFTT